MKNKKLMFEDIADVGDKIRAFDFMPQADRGDYFIEGIVIEKGLLDLKDYLSYKICLTKVVRNNVDVTDKSICKYSYVPFETDCDNWEHKHYPHGTFRVMNINKA